MNEKINLSGAWDQLYARISAGTDTRLLELLGWLGALLVVYAIVKWIWAKHQGRNERSSGLAWTLLIGAIFSAPGVLIPILLRFADWLINLVLAALA